MSCKSKARWGACTVLRYKSCEMVAGVQGDGRRDGNASLLFVFFAGGAWGVWGGYWVCACFWLACKVSINVVELVR